MLKHARVLVPLVLAAVVTASGSVASAASKRHLKPAGAAGNWKLVFDAEFNRRTLDTSAWNTHNGWADQNGVTDSSSNIALSDGHLIMTLASPTSGAEIGTTHFALKVGEFAQARIRFAGNGQTIYNWPAFWASGPSWPNAGESDVAEGLGDLTINYHSPEGADNTGTVPGTWAGGFHTYGVYRGALYDRVYWDGKLVRTYATHDDGQPQMLLLTMGAGNTLKTGSAGAMIVDYVRAWAPA